MNSNAVETVMGAVVLAVAVLFVSFAYSSAEFRGVHGYPVSAKFDHIDGIRDGGDVRLSGIKIGTIDQTELDPKTFQAVVHMTIDNAVELPADTVATITSSGLLGDKFLQLVPGNDDKTIPSGGQIRFTQAPINLESMLGQIVFSMQGGGAKPAGDQAAPAPSTAPTPSTGPMPSVPPANAPPKH
jgi:phospholipid/cholesterol/gamma-HCH transport system substrate-binding protein